MVAVSAIQYIICMAMVIHIVSPAMGITHWSQENRPIRQILLMQVLLVQEILIVKQLHLIQYHPLTQVLV